MTFDVPQEEHICYSGRSTRFQVKRQCQFVTSEQISISQPFGHRGPTPISNGLECLVTHVLPVSLKISPRNLDTQRFARKFRTVTIFKRCFWLCFQSRRLLFLIQTVMASTISASLHSRIKHLTDDECFVSYPPRNPQRVQRSTSSRVQLTPEKDANE